MPRGEGLCPFAEQPAVLPVMQENCFQALLVCILTYQEETCQMHCLFSCKAFSSPLKAIYFRSLQVLKVTTHNFLMLSIPRWFWWLCFCFTEDEGFASQNRCCQVSWRRAVDPDAGEVLCVGHPSLPPRDSCHIWHTSLSKHQLCKWHWFGI